MDTEVTLSHYNVEKRDCYINGIYKFYKVFIDGRTCWKYTYCWEEEVYDAIKDFKEPVYYNDIDAKEHFKKLKNKKVRTQSAYGTWLKRHNEILENCSRYEGGL